MEIGTLTALIVAATGLIGAVTAFLLGKRGQRNDERQQSAKVQLEKRIAAFDELESLNDRLNVENQRLLDRIADAESIGDLRLARQARRCRAALEESMAGQAALVAVVLSEVSRVAAEDNIRSARDHIATDHGDLADE